MKTKETLKEHNKHCGCCERAEKELEEANLSDTRERSTILAETAGIDEEWWYGEKKIRKEILMRLKAIKEAKQT